MTAKTYLQQIGLLNRKINHKIAELDEFRTLADGLGAVDYSADRVQSSPSADQIAARVIRMVEMERNINTLIDEYIDTKNRIINEIHGLNDTRYIDVLYKRYVEEKPFNKIADEMHYERRQLNRIHGDALLLFADHVPQCHI